MLAVVSLGATTDSVGAGCIVAAVTGMVASVRVGLAGRTASLSPKSENMSPNISIKLVFVLTWSNRCFGCFGAVVLTGGAVRVRAGDVGFAGVVVSLPAGGHDGGSSRSAMNFLALVAEDRWIRTLITWASFLGAGAVRTRH